MAGIQSSVGLVTGINIDDTVKQLLAVQAKPRDLIAAQKTALDAKQAALTDLTALILNSQFSARRLNKPELFQQKSVVSSNASVLTATASNAASAGTYQFTAIQVAQTQNALSSGLSSRTSPLGAGDFSFQFGGFANDDLNLSDLNGGAGISRGKIKITDRSGSSAVVDLRYALTVDDVVKAINQSESINVQASVAGDRFVLTDSTGGAGNLRVDEVSGGQTAASLGLGSVNVAATSATGRDILRLSATTSLDKLNDGNGVAFNAALPELQVSFRDGSSPLAIDFNRLSQPAVKASATSTAAAGINAQIKLTAATAGVDANGVTLQFVSSGAVTTGAAVAYDSAAKTITVDIAVGQTTASDVLAAINNDPATSAVFTASLPAGGDGSGIVDLTDTAITAGGKAAVAARSERTVADLLQTLNEADPARLKAELSADGDHIVLTDLTSDTGSTFAVTNLNDSGLAEKLGLAGTATGGTLTSDRLLGGLKTTLLRSLNGGQGLGTLGNLTLTDRSGATATVDLSAASTLDDVISAINGAGLGIKASYNSSRNGISLTDTTGSTSSPLIVADGDAANTATKLGLAGSFTSGAANSGSLKKQVVSQNTLLSSYFGGAGVTLGSFRITDSNGQSAIVNLAATEAKTVGDVLNAINATTIGVEAKLNEAGDGILLVNTAGGAGTLKVSEVGNGTSAASLRIAGESTTKSINGTPTQVIEGSTKLTVSLTSTDTLDTLVQKINDLHLGATASVVTQTAGATSYHLSLQSKVGGRQGELQIDGGAVGLNFNDLIAAQDGLLQFGSGTTTGALLSSTNNVYKDGAPGVDVTVLQASTSPISVTVSATASTAATALQTFVDSYNKVRAKLDTYTSYSSESDARGVLFGSSETLRIDNDLSRTLTDRISGLGGVQSLAELGVSIGTDGKLAFDSSKLNERYAADPDAVKAFFTDADRGFGKKIDAVFERLVGENNSVLINRVTSINRQLDDVTARITDFDARLARAKTTLENQFYNLELAISKIKNNLDSIGSIQYIGASS